MKRYLHFVALLVIAACTPQVLELVASPDAGTIEASSPAGEPPALRARIAKAANAARRPLASMSPGRPPTRPDSWNVTDWYVSKATGNAKYDCQHSTVSGGQGPCPSKAEVVARWQTNAPNPRSNLIVHQLDSDTDNTDQFAFDPVLSNGAYSNIQCPLGAAQQVAVVSLANVTAKNRATPQLLQANLGASAAQGMLAVNTTHPSRAWVYKNVSGNIWSLSEPIAAQTPPFNGNALTPVDTWANSDSVTLYNPVQVNLVDYQPFPADFDVVTFGNYGYVTDCAIYDPSGLGDGDPLLINNYVVFVESLAQRVVTMPSSVLPAGNLLGGGRNSYFQIGWFGGFPPSRATSGGGTLANPLGEAFYAGILGDGSLSFFNQFIAASLDYDVIVSPTAFNDPIAYGGTLGDVYLDTSTYLDIIGSPVQVANINAAPVIWGPGTINIAGTTRLLYPSGASGAANTFKNTGFVKINGATTAYSACGATLHSGVTLSAAAMDTACDATHFGGLAWSPGGGSLTNGNP